MSGVKRYHTHIISESLPGVYVHGNAIDVVFESEYNRLEQERDELRAQVEAMRVLLLEASKWIGGSVYHGDLKARIIKALKAKP